VATIAVTTTHLDAGGGRRLAVHRFGDPPPGAAPVLLAHATGFHGRVWAPVAAGLAERGWAPVSFDFRGHGASDPSPDGTYAWSEFADDVCAVLDGLGLAGGGVVAAGHSKGAAALLLAALGRPEAFRRLWCYEPIIFPAAEPLPPAENPMSAGARRRRDVWPSRHDAHRSYASRPPFDALHPDALAAYVDWGFADRPDGQVELRCRPEHEARIYMMGGNHGLYTRLDEITAPTLVVAGERTNAIAPALAEDLASRLPTGHLEIWDGRGHFGPLEDPERAAASITAFAAGPPGR
jgi:pimeloyl-ACP methyl ester carboxylesterase